MGEPSCSAKQQTNGTNGGSMLTDPPMMRPEQEAEERRHVEKIFSALRHYRKYANARVNKTESYLNSLPQRHQQMLAKYRSHLSVIRDCIDANQTVIHCMLSVKFECPPVSNEINSNCSTNGDTYLPQHDHKAESAGSSVKVLSQDMDNSTPVDEDVVERFKILKAQSTLKLIARDWSSAGAEERAQSYQPIIDAIEEFYNPDQYEINEIKILVPGAGLGRLTYELASRGYECEGNEFSYFMLIASNFVLNHTGEQKYKLYPWVHQYMNILQMSDQVACIQFPDVCLATNPPKGNIMMALGDFLMVYKEPNMYDCVATCFFIDCANNVVDFIETIYRILVPGGIWVNLGPLLYHYSDLLSQQSIEPTYENLLVIIKMVGFDIVRTTSGVRTKYAQNPNSMLKSEYESLFWICRKPLNTPADEITSDKDLDNDLMNSSAANSSYHCTNGYDKN